MTQSNSLKLWGTRLIIYAVLAGVAFIMLFPFTYMMFTSFKRSSDVFRNPPRLLPYSPITDDYQGEQQPLYKLMVDGEEREMVLTGEKIQVGFFTSAELMNVDSPRDSKFLVDLPFDEAIPTGEEVTLTSPNTGQEDTFEVYEVPYEGATTELLLAYRPRLDVFADTSDSTITAYGTARTETPVEKVDFQVDNYDTVFGLRLDRALINTALVTVGVTLGQLITSIFGGYAFARIPFKGRDTLFLAYLGSIMIPFVVLIIPLYRLMVIIGWEGRIVSLIVPWIFTAYGTFMMRQFFLTIPKEIEEAALLDGCSRLRILWQIFVPLSTPAVATQGIFTFLYAWNSFLWPLLIIGEGNEQNHVLTLSLIRLSNIAADKPNLVMTGAAVAIVPPILIFILAQRYFIEGVATSGLKG